MYFCQAFLGNLDYKNIMIIFSRVSINWVYSHHISPSRGNSYSNSRLYLHNLTFIHHERLQNRDGSPQPILRLLKDQRARAVENLVANLL